LTAEVTTLRRHMEAHHHKRYVKWCDRNDFLSMLPKAVRARREAAEATQQQQTLDAHLQSIPQAPPVLKYSDALFQEVAEEWLIMTNQPVEALSNPQYQRMIAVAAASLAGVKIPDKRTIRQSLIDRFHKSVSELRNRLNVSIPSLCTLFIYSNFPLRAPKFKGRSR
ncbi:hypothetical protein DFP72DRAFT_835444, partial [Ephemerocybe angulata]